MSPSKEEVNGGEGLVAFATVAESGSLATRTYSNGFGVCIAALVTFIRLYMSAPCNWGYGGLQYYGWTLLGDRSLYKQSSSCRPACVHSQ